MADVFTDTGFGDFGTDWWDVPADYFTGGMDLSGGMDLDPSLYSLSDPGYGTGSLDWLGDSGVGSTGSSGVDFGLDTQWLDTMTGQIVTGAQAKALDPTSWEKAIKYGIGGATALGGLGALGLGIGSLFGGGSDDAASRTQTQTSAAGQGPRSPEAMQLLGSGGGGAGLAGAAGGGGTGLLGLSNMMLQNLMGSGQGGAPGGAQPQQQPSTGLFPYTGHTAPLGGISGTIPPGGIYANPTSAYYGKSPFGGGAPGTMPGLGQPAPGAQIGQISEMPGGLQTRGPGNIGYAGGTPNFNESTGMYAPGFGPLWAQSPASWPAVSGSGGGDVSGISPSEVSWDPVARTGPGGVGFDPTRANAYYAQQNPGMVGGGITSYPGWMPPSGGGQAYGGQPQQASGQQTQSGQGLIGQQSNVLGGLQSQIPQLNPAIMQALGMQAGGMAQGYLPSLSDPQAQARIQSIYQPGFDALNYNSGLALSNAREQLQQRGFQAPDIREGPTQALTAPILAAQQLGRSQLYGQMAGAQLDLASRLPMLGSQLNAQNYSTQAQPFNLGTQLAGAYNQPIATQGQFPLSLLDILERGRGSTSTVNTVGPQPSLTQQLGQLAPVVGAGGSLLSSAGNMLWPQQQPQVGLSGIMPRYY